MRWAWGRGRACLGMFLEQYSTHAPSNRPCPRRGSLSTPPQPMSAHLWWGLEKAEIHLRSQMLTHPCASVPDSPVPHCGETGAKPTTPGRTPACPQPCPRPFLCSTQHQPDPPCVHHSEAQFQFWGCTDRCPALRGAPGPEEQWHGAPGLVWSGVLGDRGWRCSLAHCCPGHLVSMKCAPDPLH